MSGQHQTSKFKFLCRRRVFTEVGVRSAGVLTVEILGLLALGFSCTALLAREDIVVVKEGASKSAIDIAGLRIPADQTGAVFRQTLAGDLERSGWFRIASPGRGAIAVRGAFIRSGRTLSVNCEVLNTASGRTCLRQEFKGQATLVRRLAHRLADEIVRAVKNVPGIALTRIALVGAHVGGKDVYVIDADGGNLVKITREGAVCLSPNWWPDANALAYTSFHGGFPDVYRIDLVENRRRKIASFPGLNAGADVSPNGRSLALALSKDGNPELYVMDLGNGRLTRMTRSPHCAEASPSWSPDGRRIVYVSDSSGSPQLYVIDRRKAQSRRISFRGRENVAPDWGPDGRIVYSSRREGRYQLCIYEPASERTTQLTRDGVDHEDPSWAPDGRHIVHVRTTGYDSDLYVLDTMGDAPLRLTTLEGDWYSPAWSPR